MLVFVCLAMLFGYMWKYGLFGCGLGDVLCMLHGGALVLVRVHNGCAQPKILIE